MYKKKRKLFKQQEQIYINLTEIRTQMLRIILLTATMKMKCCYSNQFVKDWSEMKCAKLTLFSFLSVKNVWNMSRIWDQNDRN